MEHPEYEYALYVQRENACPYIATIMDSMEKVKLKIEQIKKTHCYRYNRIFYIDNDFYKNEYKLGMGGTYYKFVRRKVNDWEDFTLEEKELPYLRLVT